MNEPTSERLVADANPAKRLFISLLTRDISMAAAFLDLIDNSLNSALQPHATILRTAQDFADALTKDDLSPDTHIRLSLSPDRIRVADNAGGISLDDAQHRVFRFGRPDDAQHVSDRLSVYGLGLKRAFFKLGRQITIVSDHVDGGFELHLDVTEWSKTLGLPWSFDLIRRSPSDSSRTGTRIEITNLYPEVTMRLQDDVFEGALRQTITDTYAYFLTKFVRITLNDYTIEPANLLIDENHSTSSFELHEVTCTIVAGIGKPDAGEYRDSTSGWYVFCNGRAVINADKTAMTGWQNNGLPIFQPKHRPFLGIVYFVSSFADRLPWDTTKSGINVDSEIWQQARRKMVLVGRSVTSFLDSRYREERTSAEERDLENVTRKRVNPMTISSSSPRSFQPPKPVTRSTMRIQYDARIVDIDRISTYLARPGMSGSEVGRHTFDFFLRNEVEGD